MMHSREKIQVLPHILAFFKNDASLPLGKKNKQSPKLFTKKSPKNFEVTWQKTNREGKNLPSHKSRQPLVKCTSALWWHAACQSNVCLWETWTQGITDLFNLFTSNTQHRAAWFDITKNSDTLYKICRIWVPLLQALRNSTKNMSGESDISFPPHSKYLTVICLVIVMIAVLTIGIFFHTQSSTSIEEHHIFSCISSLTTNSIILSHNPQINITGFLTTVK